MTENPESPHGVRARGRSLSIKLVLLVTGSLVLVGMLALAVFLPAARRQFVDHTEDLVLRSHEGMLDISEHLIESHVEVVLDHAMHMSDTYARELADLPLRLASGDESKIKSMILEQVRELRRRTIQNVEIIGEELRFRSEADVARKLDDQREVQRQEGTLFARELKRRSIGFVAFLVLAPLPLLLLGLYRMVIRPLTSLSAATRRASTGDLDFSVPVSARDEIGSVQSSFNRMISDLAQSRSRIQEWNTELERRVREKTAALTEALESQKETTRRLEATLGELRATQDQLVHAEKMAGLGSLAASVAHEFNNLLGGILGSAESALEETPQGTARDALEVVRRAARRACGITENLLRFSRKDESHKEPVELNALVEDCVRLLEPEARARKVRLEAALDELPIVPADPGQIHQVVLNLLANAVHAVDSGGRVRVETSAREDTVLVAVSDDGPGVPAADRSRIFEPFYTTRGDGTGLGLAVSYGIVTGHGGRIEVADALEGGARFEVRLPLGPRDGGAS